jgi:hypothetical protein
MQGVKKICSLSWLTNSAIVYESKRGGKGRVAGSQPRSEERCTQNPKLTPYLTFVKM